MGKRQRKLERQARSGRGREGKGRGARGGGGAHHLLGVDDPHPLAPLALHGVCLVLHELPLGAQEELLRTANQRDREASSAQKDTMARPSGLRGHSPICSSKQGLAHHDAALELVAVIVEDEGEVVAVESRGAQGAGGAAGLVAAGVRHLRPLDRRSVSGRLGGREGGHLQYERYRA